MIAKEENVDAQPVLFYFTSSDRTQHVREHAEACARQVVVAVKYSLANQRRSATPSTAEPANDEIGDYVPASYCLDTDMLTTYKKLTAFLRRHPEIRTRKPNRQRLLVHAADFMRAQSQEEADRGVDEGSDAAIAVYEARKAAIRAQKG
jgi:hypothetical protein